RDDGARGGIALDRVHQHEVAALGELGVDQAAGGIERGLGLGVTPAVRTEGLLRLGPERGRLLGPAGAHADLREVSIQLLEARGLLELLRRRVGHRHTISEHRLEQTIYTETANL